MNILWVVNSALPEASLILNDTISPFGGWLISASKDLANQQSIKLSIAFPRYSKNTSIVVKGESIDYYPFRKNSSTNKLFENEKFDLNQIIKLSKPDIVHIFGTEFIHTLEAVKIAKELKIKSVISIQGLVSIYSNHYLAYTPDYIHTKRSFRDFVKNDSIIKQQKLFAIRGENEKNALKIVSHVIGRTTWDKACVKQINPEASYHFCNESLRGKFYENKWDIDNCEKNSVFISQGSYPIKGLHLAIEAISIVKNNYPDIKLYVGGAPLIKDESFYNKIKKSSYEVYIRSLINKYDLKSNIIFTGLLSESQMCDRFLKTNVFILPSSVENSPNSLGEAMILGVPSIASNVGGVSDMIVHNKEGYTYPADAPYMLAYYICDILENKDLANLFSANARNKALKTHNIINNTLKLVSIYKDIHNKEN